MADDYDVDEILELLEPDELLAVRDLMRERRTGELDEVIEDLDALEDQLAGRAPPAAAGPGICASCGCTEARACPGGCLWANRTATLCSRCARSGTAS